MTTGLLETDILTDPLKDERRVIINKVWDVDFSYGHTHKTALQERGKTPDTAKSIYDFYELVRQAIRSYESRAGITPTQNADKRVRYTEEDPDEKSETDTITVSLVGSLPGSFGKGAQGEARTRVYTDRIMEEYEDPLNPGYRVRVAGLLLDNIVRFTCWARTNKKANERARWFKSFLDEYTWWLRYKGVGRILWREQGTDIVKSVNEIKWYGRPLDFFVQTWDIKTQSQKSMDEILINMAIYTG